MSSLSRAAITPREAIAPETASPPARRGTGRSGAVLPLLVAVANAVVLLVKLPGILVVLYLNSDTASAPVIATLLRTAPSERVATLGNYPWYEALWFMEATFGLPGHRVIWEVAPVVWTALAFALLISLARAVFGWWQAVITAALLACIAPFEQSVFLTLDTHGPLLVHAVVLLAALIVLERARQPIRWRYLVAIGLPLVLFTAVGLASDFLTLFTGLVPFLAAALLVAARSRRRADVRIGGFALLVAATAMLVGEWFAAVMRADHVAGVPLVVHLVRPGNVASNLEIFVKSFTNLAGGDFLDPISSGAVAVTWALGLLALGALACVLVWALGRGARRLVDRTPRITSSVRTAYVTFWLSALIATSAVFLSSSVPQDSHSARYLANAFVAVVALVPVLGAGSRRARVVTVCAVTLFGALTLYGTLREPSSPTAAVSPITPRVALDIEHFVRAEDARYGYAGYWDAAALTWQTQFGVIAYPALDCGAPAGTLCRFPLNQISSWYQPARPGPRFLVLDPTEVDPLLADPAAGPPLASARFGSIEVVVYGHDLAPEVH